MFSTDVTGYTIDLAREEGQRWQEVIASDLAAAWALVDETAADFARVPEFVRRLFAHLYQMSGGHYQQEIVAWAAALGVSVGTATMLNCVYELSHLRVPRLLGCTAGVRWVEGLGMVHVRTLDWPLPSIGNGTRLFNFVQGPRRFVVVGMPGHVGVLSGMVPGAYSVTINWAPPAGFPTFDWGPCFLLRHTLETCNSFDEALDRLRRTQLSTSVFFTLCGIDKGQACVIERTARSAVVRTMTDPMLVQTNHHVAERFEENNQELRRMAEGEGGNFFTDSGIRRDTLSKALAAVPSADLAAAACVLDLPPVLNEYTYQQMAFCPARGEVQVWRRIASANS
jgi:hypothetical protein